MTYKNCKKVIENQIKKRNAEIITAEEYEAFKSDMTNKLDVFLLNNRITKEQYNELIGIM
jgi:hypothetical protein